MLFGEDLTDWGYVTGSVFAGFSLVASMWAGRKCYIESATFVSGK